MSACSGRLLSVQYSTVMIRHRQATFSGLKAQSCKPSMFKHALDFYLMTGFIGLESAPSLAPLRWELSRVQTLLDSLLGSGEVKLFPPAFLVSSNLLSTWAVSYLKVN
ncbi:hypothetical protein M758_1G091100 [Ceratodon purpureus]|nr:hypothetical protein M758_1G091100 [Ceratodon purpureus]